MQNHQPVLVKQIIKLTYPKPGETFLDLTSGFGGHSSKLLEAVGESGFGYLIDRDVSAVKFLKKKFSNANNVSIYHSNFSEVGNLGISPVDICLMDLGVSSKQLDQADRGFSFNKEARLDMRMDITQRLDASYVVNKYSYAKLASIIKEYGEETKANKIAKAIVEYRKVKTIANTLELASLIRTIVKRKGKIDPATKTFQAIRIEVNDELTEIKKGLQAITKLLKPGGRLAVISFHSLEDRIVKRFINDNSNESTDITGKVVKAKIFEKVTKKPILGKTEIDFNRRARSAKLRVAVKIK